jgi:hypothetical protein
MHRPLASALPDRFACSMHAAAHPTPNPAKDSCVSCRINTVVSQQAQQAVPHLSSMPNNSGVQECNMLAQDASTPRTSIHLHVGTLAIWGCLATAQPQGIPPRGPKHTIPQHQLCQLAVQLWSPVHQPVTRVTAGHCPHCCPMHSGGRRVSWKCSPTQAIP